MDALTLITHSQRLAGRVDAGFDERSLGFLNEAIEAWSLALPWSTLRNTITLVCDGTRDLIFPDFVRTVRWLADQTNRNPIEPKDFWDRENPSAYLGNTTGPPSWWREGGMVPVYRLLTDAVPSQITFRSTVSESYSCHLAGLSIDTSQSGTAGYRYFSEEKVIISGSGPATTTGFYVQLRSIGKSQMTTVDTLILNGATQIGRIPAGHQDACYRRVELLTIPAAGTLITAGVIHRAPDLTETYQIPHCSISRSYLKWYTAALIHKSQNQSDQGELCMQRANQILAQCAYQEKMAGDKDLSASPDQGYWGSEDSYTWW